MLNALRDGAKSGFLKYILLGFMALAVGGLVLTDVGGFFRGGVSNNYVAKGKGIEISTMQFDQTVRRILSRQQMSPQEAYGRGLINQILQSEIQTMIVTREAQKLGLIVGDETVTQQIAKLAAPLAQDGQSKSDALKQILRAQGISETQFVNSIRQEMANGAFQNAVFSGVGNISDAQAKALYEFQNESLSFKGVRLKADNIETEVPTDEQLQNYYNANKSDFAIAERRDITIATLKKETLEKTVTITDEELMANYEDNLDTYRKPEQRKVQQAVFKSEAEAQETLSQLEKNKNLKAIVKKVTGQESAYLGENEFGENGLLEIVAKPVFAADKGDIVGPIQSPLGFHVLILKDIIEPQTTPFAKVKKSIRDNMLQDRLAEDLIETANMLDDQLAGGAPLEEVVNELGLTTETFKGLNQAGYNSQNKDALSAYQGNKAQILEAAFDFDAGEASPVMELADGRFVTVNVDSVTERSHKPFDEVKSALSKRWKAEQQALANRARAEDLLASLKAETALDDAAKELGLKTKTYKNLKRNEEPASPLIFSQVQQMFDADVNAPLMIATGDGFLIGQVIDRELPQATSADKAINEIKEKVSAGLQQEIVSQYINHLAQKYDVRINDAILREVYGTQQN